MALRFSMTLLCALISARSVASLQVLSAPEAPTDGTGKISGRVVADNGAPVQRARVHLSGNALVWFGPPDDPRTVVMTVGLPSREVESDSEGRFQFLNLPAGGYDISVQAPNGYVNPARHFQTPLGDGETRERVFRLPRTGAIEGRVLDHDGHPMLGIAVLAFERVNVAGYLVWGQRRGSAQTDDRGVFRLFHLPPGSYYVIASDASRRLMATHGPPPPDVGPITTYYPGAMSRAAARAVTVAPGRDTQGLGFRMVNHRLATVGIDATDAMGQPLSTTSHTYVTLQRRGFLRGDLRNDFSQPSLDRTNGRFTFRGVEPGDYEVLVSKEPFPKELGYRAITVGDSDVAVRVQTNLGATVSGRVMIDGRPISTRPDYLHGFPRINGQTCMACAMPT